MAQPLDLFFLGSGNAFAPGRYWSTFLLNGRYLFDCAPTALPHLKRAGVPLADIDTVFISHFHADHFFGLPFLLLEYAEGVTERARDLTVIGPPGLADRLRTVTEAGYPSVFDRDKPYRERYIEVTDGAQGEVTGLTYLAREVTHVSSLTCFGFRVEVGGRTLAYSGDSTLCDALVELAEGVDVFVLECSCWEGTCGPHLSPDDVRDLRRRLGPEPVFVLTHLDGGVRDIGVENTVVAEDLGRLTL